MTPPKGMNSMGERDRLRAALQGCAVQISNLDRKKALNIAAEYGEGPGWLTYAVNAAEIASAENPSIDRLGMLGLTILDMRNLALAQESGDRV